MRSLRVNLLGGFNLHDAGGRKIAISGTKAVLLFATLALRPGEAQTREKLMALLWNDRAEAQARGSLRQAIWALRRALESIRPDPLVVEGETLALDPEAVETDVASLERLIAQGSTDALYTAVALYRGPLLDGLKPPNAAFEVFVRSQQRHIFDLVIDAYTRLLEGDASRSAKESVAATAKSLLEIDPVQEVAHRALIRYYAGKGQTGLAVRQYQTCCEVLRQELDVEPSEVTTALVEEVKSGHCGFDFEGERNRAMNASSDSEAAQVLPPAHEKPSIAVLPFLNMSGDPDQEYFSDGITGDIITALSRFRWFMVIARHSSFVYKGRNVDITQVGRDLGVRYVLEGSVQKSGNRLRITAQLADAANGVEHWAESYDRDLTDIFELQDDIARSVTAAIEPKLLAIEGVRVQNRSPSDLGAWELLARAMTYYGRMTTQDSDAAIEILQQAVKSYPDYGPAHSLLAFALLVSGHVGWTPESQERHYAAELAHRAARLDDEDPWAHVALGYLAFTERQTEEAVRQFNRALDLNPNFSIAYGYLGWALVFDGQSEEAIRYLEQALRMSPHDPLKAFFLSGTGVAHYYAHRYEEGIEWARKAVRERPEFAAAWRILCANLAQTDRTEELSQALVKLHELQPNITITWIQKYVPYTDRAMPHFLDGMRKAGLPE